MAFQAFTPESLGNHGIYAAAAVSLLLYVLYCVSTYPHHLPFRFNTFLALHSHRHPI